MKDEIEMQDVIEIFALQDVEASTSSKLHVTQVKPFRDKSGHSILSDPRSPISDQIRSQIRSDFFFKKRPRLRKLAALAPLKAKAPARTARNYGPPVWSA